MDEGREHCHKDTIGIHASTMKENNRDGQSNITEFWE